MNPIPTFQSVPFAKGHGTQNDFIVLPDPEGQLNLTARQVIQLCDRRSGIGADGILRAVRSATLPRPDPMAAEAEWFMDYRNADGSFGTMCGNGIRVLARYLVATGLAEPGTLIIDTRAGPRTVRVQQYAHGPVSVMMGRPRYPGPNNVEVAVAGLRWPALHVDMGNPHAVVLLNDPAQAGDLATAPIVTPATAYPHGVTVEFVAVRAPGRLAMRVHERGVGETRSCGTGACAAVAAVHRQRPRQPGTAQYSVEVPGGQLHVTVNPDGSLELTGPAEIVARGAVDLPD